MNEVSALDLLLMGAIGTMATGIAGALMTGRIRLGREVERCEKDALDWRTRATDAEAELKAQTKDSMALAMTTAENQKLFAASLERFSRLIAADEAGKP